MDCTRIIAISAACLCFAGCASEVGTEPEVLPDAPMERPEPAGDAYDWITAVSHVDGSGEHVFCTGVVVGPYAVLTMSRCAGTETVDTAVLLGPDARYTRQRVPVTEAVMDDASQLALLITDEPLEASVATVASTGLSAGSALTVVGYGLSEPGASVRGIRHEIPVTVARAADDGALLLGGERAPCDGDVGAPLLDDEGRVVGLVSEVGASCAGTTSTFAMELEPTMPLIELGADRTPTGR